MKMRFILTCLGVVLITLAAAGWNIPAYAQMSLAASQTPSPSKPASSTPSPTNLSSTLTPTTKPTTAASPTQVDLSRPFIVIQNYSADSQTLEPGSEFNVNLTIANTGAEPAYQIVLSFNSSSDTLPIGNGGVHTIDRILPGETVQISQAMLCNQNLGSMASIPVQISYIDEDTFSYNQTYTLAFSVNPRYPTTTPVVMPTTFGRPFVTLQNYDTGIGLLIPEQPFQLTFVVVNTGQTNALNLALSFEGTDVFPSQTVGVYNVSMLGAGSSLPVTQPMLVNKDLGTKTMVSTVVKVNYNDDTGKTYEERYTLSFPTINTTATTTPTTTPTVWLKPQLLVAAYTTSAEVLYPGDEFEVEMQINNMGVTMAHAVNMMIGRLTDLTTPEAGVSSSTTTTSTTGLNFAPVNSANRKFLGDIPVKTTIKARQKLIVNVESPAGAQPLEITFSYTDDKSTVITETQTITLLVYSPLQIDTGFSGTVPPLNVGESTPLTLQVTNLGKKTILLGNLEVEGDKLEIESINTIIGSLDSGGFFTADIKVTAKEAGKQKLNVIINYLDDFGKKRSIKQTLEIEAEVPPTPPPPAEDANQQQGGLWDQIVRFIRGLFGLESAPPAQDAPSGGPNAAPGMPEYPGG